TLTLLPLLLLRRCHHYTDGSCRCQRAATTTLGQPPLRAGVVPAGSTSTNVASIGVAPTGSRSCERSPLHAIAITSVASTRRWRSCVRRPGNRPPLAGGPGYSRLPLQMAWPSMAAPVSRQQAGDHPSTRKQRYHHYQPLQ
ncbi:hypothetical protein BHE74_00047993, partial [Ensete ventricosum]